MTSDAPFDKATGIKARLLLLSSRLSLTGTGKTNCLACSWSGLTASACLCIRYCRLVSVCVSCPRRQRAWVRFSETFEVGDACRVRTKSWCFEDGDLRSPCLHRFLKCNLHGLTFLVCKPGIIIFHLCIHQMVLP